MASTAHTWTKHYVNGFGSAARIQRNYYAFLVMMTISGAHCPACMTPWSDAQGAFEVDRTEGGEQDANGSEVYRQGSFVYVCQPCNHSRGILQAAGKDWTNVDEYQRIVREASAQVEVPTMAAAKVWWQARKTSARVNRFA